MGEEPKEAPGTFRREGLLDLELRGFWVEIGHVIGHCDS